MPDAEHVLVDCSEHGREPAAVLCQHLHDRSAEGRGFVENSSDPRDLQAWCEQCEARFLAEGGEMTEAFRRFHGMAVVCVRCYERARRAHTRATE